MSKYIGSTLVAGVGRNTERNANYLLDFKWSDHIINSMEWLRADTFSWQDGSVYLAAYNHLVADVTGKALQSETVAGVTVQFYLADDGHKVCPANQESNVASIFSATGVAWYYILDTANTRFKLPRSKHEHYGDRPVVGNGVALGFTNGSGNYAGLVSGSQGSLYHDTTQVNTQLPSAGGATNKGFGSGTVIGLSTDGTKSGIISTPVQDTDQYKYLYFYVGQYTQSAIEQTAGLNAELFNGKQDKLPDTADYVVESKTPTSADPSWYRIYKSGWVEQGGLYPTVSSRQTVNLLVKMANTDYSVMLSIYNPSNSGGSYTIIQTYIKTTDNFGYYMAGGSSAYPMFWRVSGMAEQI